MNRAERRRQQRKEEKVQQATAHVMTSYEKARSEGFKAGWEAALSFAAGRSSRLMTTAWVAVLRGEDKFGKKRMTQRLQMVQATLEDIADDMEREQKLRDWIQREIDIDLNDHTGCRRLDIAEEMDFTVEGAMVKQ